MAKRKRSNWPKVEGLLSQLHDVHSRAERYRSNIDTLIADRVAVLNVASDTRTAGERDYIAGYARGLWEQTWRKLVWKLGTEDIATATRDWPYGERPDGSRNLPTHGGHFWPTGELATEWKAV